MSAYVYTALTVLAISHPLLSPSKGHITTSFTKVESKLPNLASKDFILPWANCDAMVTSVEYWAEADVTVAVVNCPSAERHHKDMVKLGFGYEKEFIPHITLSKGNTAEDRQELVGVRYVAVDVYCGFVIKEEATSEPADAYPSNDAFQFVPNPDVQELPGYIHNWLIF